jgi:glycosyltransferase involved in cell wall biosynthesis
MKVALVAPPYNSHDAGVGRNVRELAHGVARAGGQVEVLASLPEAVRSSAFSDGVDVRHVCPQGGSGYGASHAIWSHLRRHGEHYDLVHAHGYLTLPAVLGARRLFGRLVFSPRNDGGPPSRARQMSLSPYRQLGRTALSSADLVICSSASEASEIRRVIPAIGARVRIVSKGIDANAITGARPFKAERRVILSVGHARGRGRADLAISALPALGPGYELVVVRPGAAHRRLRACAEDLQVSDQVRILGNVSDGVLHRWLRTASVVIALGQDPDGLNLMEAAAAGAPVICSDTSAHREVARLIDDAAVRLTSSQASPLAIADEMAELAEMRIDRVATLAVPSLEDVADQTVSLYSALLDNRLKPDLTSASSEGRLISPEEDADLQALGGAV